MPNKIVVPGSITEPYKIGQGDFAPNLVGQQFTDGVTLFTLGNFAITTNANPVTSNVYSTGTFSESYNLNDLDLTNIDSEELSNESLKIILNLDPNRIERYVYFGSFYEFIKSNIEQILLKWKGSLFIENLLDDDPTRTYKNTVLNYQYDSLSGTSTFKIPTVLIKNKFALIYSSEVLFSTYDNYGDISNLNTSFQDYQISNIFGDFYVLGFTGSTNIDNYIYLQVNGNPWPNLVGVGFGSFNYHVRPKEEIINKYFFSKLNEFESLILNRLVSPPYTISVDLPLRNESGAIFSSNRRLTWPTTDGYNLDNGSTEFTNYLNDWIDIALQMDQNKTDLVARRFVTESIIEFDTEGDGTEIYGRKVNKLLRLYGREFDQVKQYIDGITFSRVVTYNKKDNTADELVKVLASELGLDVLLSYFDNNLFGNFLPSNSGEEGYGATFNTPFSGYSRGLSPRELDFELWRRLVINAWWLFKSKGHRKVLEFFLNLFRIQECVVSLDEYLYIVKDRLNVDETLNTIADYLGIPLDELLVQSGDGIINGGYPIDNFGFPYIQPFDVATEDNDRVTRYYQAYGFWYNGGNLSDLGNNPHIGVYDYGKHYVDGFRCFIDNFSAVTINTVNFITLDNLFTEYSTEDSNTQDNVPSYGENFAEILNNNGQVSSNATILAAGASTDIVYNSNSTPIRITFNYGGSNCELTCPTDLVYYDNGVIFANEQTTLILTESNISGYIDTNQQDLIDATEISQTCCLELGGYYLPASTLIPNGVGGGICPSEGQLMILESGLVLGINKQACCQNSVVGSNVYWDGSRCLLVGTNINAVEDIFTVNELFGNTITDNLACFWCPPTKLVCDDDYYSLKSNITVEPNKREVKGVSINTDSTFKSGCNLANGSLYTDPDGYTYVIQESPSTLPLIMCDSFYSSSWEQIPGSTLFQKGCCKGYRTCDKVSTLDSTGCEINPLKVVTRPDKVLINEGTPIGGECCDSQILGYDVHWNGEYCILGNAPETPTVNCVIVSISDKNITNEKCCNTKGGVLGEDSLGNIICLKNIAVTNNGSTPVDVLDGISLTDINQTTD
jgi:hypothetical protein